MRQWQEVQEVLPALRIFPARPAKSAVRKLSYGPARSAATQLHLPHPVRPYCFERRKETLLHGSAVWTHCVIRLLERAACDLAGCLDGRIRQVVVDVGQTNADHRVV